MEIKNGMGFEFPQECVEMMAQWHDTVSREREGKARRLEKEDVCGKESKLKNTLVNVR